MTSYQHPKCFQVPPRALKGVSPEDFVNTHLTDSTEDSMLDNETTKQEVIDAVAYKPPRGSTGGKKEEGGESAIQKKLAGIKALMEKLPNEDSDEEEERPAKKAKTDEDSIEMKEARAMKIYSSMKNDDLKSVLRWNLGYGTSATKDILMMRCIDGHVYGRLERCPTCFKGKLQIKDADPNAIACPGYYDEDIAVRISCGYTTKVSAAPRLQPWYSSEPTDEEIEAMKAITDQHEKVGSGKGSGEVPPDLLEAAENLDCEEMGDFMELDNRAKAQALVDLCTKGATKIDLPQDEKKARQAVGKILMNNLEKNAVELLKDVMEQFGMVGMKEDAKAKQKSAIGSSCTCAANAGIVQAFQELKDYYFKDGNSNAGGTYQKAITALLSLDYEITADNAKGLGKGKTKLPGIGKGSADKIHEFVTSGTIQKLEEKRLLHAA